MRASRAAAAAALWVVVVVVSLCVAAVVEAKLYACRGSSGVGVALRSNANVTVQHTKGVGYAFVISPAVVLSPFIDGPNLTRGVVILPEPDVAPEAYAPLARALALSGCYAAVVDKATPGRTMRAMLQRPQIEYWTLAGHGRVGGALAARLAFTLQPKVKALILLAAPMPADVDMTNVNVIVVALYGQNDTLVTPAAVEASFARMPGDASVTSFPHLGHYDFIQSDCTMKGTHPDVVLATLVANISIPIAITQWAAAGKKALSFSDNARLTPGKNISKPYPGGDIPGDSRVHFAQSPIPHTSPQRFWFVFTPTGAIKGGLVYYPGAAVDARAYFPLAFEIAARGHAVVIVQMPLRLANFEDANAVIDSRLFSRIPKWAVGGHSQGGFAVSMYVAAYSMRIYAAVMHAGLWATNLTLNPLPVANIYGTLDSLTPGGFDRYRYLNTDPPPKGMGPLVNLKTAKFVPIEGGNHYQMGDYGYQSPDEIATISMEQQWAEVAQATVAFLDETAAASP